MKSHQTHSSDSNLPSTSKKNDTNLSAEQLRELESIDKHLESFLDVITIQNEKDQKNLDKQQIINSKSLAKQFKTHHKAYAKIRGELFASLGRSDVEIYLGKMISESKLKKQVLKESKAHLKSQIREREDHIRYLKNHLKRIANEKKPLKLPPKLKQILDWSDEDYAAWEKVKANEAVVRNATSYPSIVYNSIAYYTNMTTKYILGYQSHREVLKEQIEDKMLQLVDEDKIDKASLAETDAELAELNGDIRLFKSIKGKMKEIKSKMEQRRKLNRIMELIDTYQSTLTELYSEANTFLYNQENYEDIKFSNPDDVIKYKLKWLINSYEQLISKIETELKNNKIRDKIIEKLKKLKYELPNQISSLEQLNSKLRTSCTQLRKELPSLQETIGLLKKLQLLDENIKAINPLSIDSSMETETNSKKHSRQFKKLQRSIEIFENNVTQIKKNIELQLASIDNNISGLKGAGKKSLLAKNLIKLLKNRKEQLANHRKTINRQLKTNRKALKQIEINRERQQQQHEETKKLEQFEMDLSRIPSLEMLAKRFLSVKNLIPSEEKSFDIYLRIFTQMSQYSIRQKRDFLHFMNILSSFESFLHQFLESKSNYDDVQTQLMNIIHLLVKFKDAKVEFDLSNDSNLAAHLVRLICLSNNNDISQTCIILLNCAKLGITLEPLLAQIKLESFISKINQLDNLHALMDAVWISTQTFPQAKTLNTLLQTLKVRENEILAKTQEEARRKYISKISHCSSVREFALAFKEYHAVIQADENQLELYRITLRHLATCYSSASRHRPLPGNLAKLIVEVNDFILTKIPPSHPQLTTSLVCILNSMNGLNVDLPEETKKEILSLITPKNISSCEQHVSSCMLIFARAGLDIREFLNQLMNDTTTEFKLRDLSELIFACYLHDANHPNKSISEEHIQNIFKKIVDYINENTIKKVSKSYGNLNELNNHRILKDNLNARISCMNLFCSQSDRFLNSSLKASSDARYILQAAAFYRFEFHILIHQYLANLLESNDKQTISPEQEQLFRYLAREFSEFPQVEVKSEEKVKIIFSADIHIKNTDTHKVTDVEYDGQHHVYQAIFPGPSNGKREDRARDSTLKRLDVDVYRFGRGDLTPPSRRLCSFVEGYKRQLTPVQQNSENNSAMSSEQTGSSSGQQEVATTGKSKPKLSPTSQTFFPKHMRKKPAVPANENQQTGSTSSTKLPEKDIGIVGSSTNPPNKFSNI